MNYKNFKPFKAKNVNDRFLLFREMYNISIHNLINYKTYFKPSIKRAIAFKYSFQHGYLVQELGKQLNQNPNNLEDLEI